MSLHERMPAERPCSREIFGTGPYTVAGIGVNAGVYGCVPEALIARWAGP